MTTAGALLLVGVVGAITYALRAGLILTLADREIPAIVARALRNVSPAVLSALVVSLVANPGASNVGVTSPEVAGVVVAGVLAWWSRNLIVTVVGAMTAFWILLALS